MPNNNDTKKIVTYKDDQTYRFEISESGKDGNRCQYVHRSGPLHYSVKIGGTIGLGRCCNEALPGMLFCYIHASRDAMSLLIRNLNAELEGLKMNKNKERKNV